MGERWLSVPGLEHYEVSDTGGVRRKDGRDIAQQLTPPAAKQIAARFGVKNTAIYNLLQGVTWARP